MKKLLLITFATSQILSGCVTPLDKRAMTDVDISDDGHFFIITERWSDTQKTSENLLRRWIDEYVADNKLCDMKGFEKFSTKDIVVDKMLFGSVYKRQHRFKCKN